MSSRECNSCVYQRLVKEYGSKLKREDRQHGDTRWTTFYDGEVADENFIVSFPDFDESYVCKGDC